MTSVEVHSFCFLLKFAQPLKMSLLSNIYEAIPGVIYAEPNGICCDGDNIEWFKKNNIWHLIFSHGLGDCPAGCIYRYYWYVTVDENLMVQLVDEKERDFRVPYIYIWNIPPRYAATVFSGADEILSAAQSATEWWIRRHAIEVIRRLFTNDYPWVGEDLDNAVLFQSIRNDILSHRQEVIEALIQLLDDPDPDVRTSAQWALNKSLGLDGGTLAYYFPMHIGNQWMFDHIPETIIDTMRINDLIYYKFDEYRNQGNIYLRMSSDNKLFLRYEEKEQLWLDFSAAVGDSWIVTEWTVYLQSKTDTITVPAGTFTNCYQFWFSFGCCDNDWVEWYAPGIGPVKRIL
ncbi:MAG: HEAT repeat domain-containing protein, partial [Candidatus Marinimicrobia bacterium]|nr:HEAT repeat domain-containing protein [Candidatus Neomarinimicrobiota bacterium]